MDIREDVEKYRPGGLHPVHLGDAFKNGRYTVLHKLGYGGFSTVWLARDEIHRRLVSLKVLSADASHRGSEVIILRHLDQHLSSHPMRNRYTSILDTFTLEGPNGTHMCHVSKVGGPSAYHLSDSPGQLEGSRRLRASIARKLASQLAASVSWLHSVGVVHGDITAKNVLLHLSNIDSWSLEDVHEQLGFPVTEELFTFSGDKPDSSAPDYIVQPTSFDSLAPGYLRQELLLIDMGEAFFEGTPPAKGVGTPMSSCSPELILEKKASRWSDTWALACTMFKLRAGYDLFGSFVGMPSEVLGQMAEMLGLFPTPWWPLLEQYGIQSGGKVRRVEYTLRQWIEDIGMGDEEAQRYVPGNAPQRRAAFDDALIETKGTRISEDEVNALEDLLKRALHYAPEQRLSVDALLKHRWLVDEFE